MEELKKPSKKHIVIGILAGALFVVGGYILYKMSTSKETK